MISRIIYKSRNQYGEYSVEEMDYDGRHARVLFSGPPLHAAQSGIGLDDNPRLLFDYNQRFLELALIVKPAKVLLLGGGPLTLVSVLAKHHFIKLITVIEQNADYVEIGKKFFDYNPSAKVEVLIEDAYLYMEANSQQYDLILVDLYDNFSIPFVFLSSKFAIMLQRSLSIKGVVAINCIASLEGKFTGPLANIVSVWGENIGHVQLYRAGREVFYWAQQNIIVIASPNRKRQWFSMLQVIANSFTNI